MKVAQILFSGLGGHGSVAFSLQAAAARATGDGGRHAMVFLGTEDLLPEYDRLCAERGLERRYVRARAGAPWRSWPPLFRALLELNPDAIVLHSVKAVLPVWLYARARGVRLVAVEHQANPLKTRAEWTASRLLMRMADAVVMLTPAYRADLKAGLGAAWREDRARTIPNGIDTDLFSPAARKAAGGPRVIGMASRFTDNKRHEALIGAMALLKAADRPDAWRLTLAGDGETRERLMALAREAGVADVVDFPGYLGEAELLAWFKGLDLYAHATDGETLSTSILQAMAMALPIVGSDVTGVTSLLAEGGGVGAIARGQTPEAFAEAFRALVADPASTAAMAARARDRAVAVYSQDAMHRAYRALLEA